MNRRAIAALFAALALLSGAACGTEPADTPPADNGAVQPEVGGPGLGDPGGMVDSAEQSIQDSVNKVEEGFNANIPTNP